MSHPFKIFRFGELKMCAGNDSRWSLPVFSAIAYATRSEMLASFTLSELCKAFPPKSSARTFRATPLSNLAQNVLLSTVGKIGQAIWFAREPSSRA
jgi:hypothetical protein